MPSRHHRRGVRAPRGPRRPAKPMAAEGKDRLAGDAIYFIQNLQIFNVQDNTGTVSLAGGQQHSHGDIRVAAQFIQQLAEQPARAALQQQLQRLQAELEGLLHRLPTAEQEEAARCLKELARQANQPKPQRRWYSVAAEGLVEAAKACLPLSGPFVAAVQALRQLLDELADGPGG